MTRDLCSVQPYLRREICKVHDAPYAAQNVRYSALRTAIRRSRVLPLALNALNAQTSARALVCLAKNIA